MSSIEQNEKDFATEIETADIAQFRPDVDVSAVDGKRLLRRIDWHVVPWLTILYLLSFLDRGSIGNARVHQDILNA